MLHDLHCTMKRVLVLPRFKALQHSDIVTLLIGFNIFRGLGFTRGQHLRFLKNLIDFAGHRCIQPLVTKK